MRGHRELLGAALVCLVGAALALLAAGQEWSVVALANGGSSSLATTGGVSGAELAPVVPAASLGALAAVGALAAARGRLRQGVGLVLLALGIAVTTATMAPPRTGSFAWFAYAPAGSVPVVSGTAWRWVAAVGGLLQLLAGLWVLWRGRRWPGLGRRYDSPAPSGGPSPEAAAARRTRPAGRDDAWTALDRGEDPTVPPGSPPPPD